MARKQKLLEQSTAHLTVLQQEAKFKAETLAKDGLEELQPTPPNYLTSSAQTEWKRIIKDLRQLPVRNLDHATVELYCTWYSMYKDLLNKINKSKASDRLKYSRDLAKITQNIKSLTSDLGLTVDSRMRIYTPKTEDKPKSIKEMFE